MDWHPAQVKAALEMANTNLSKLARQHGYAHFTEVLRRPWVAAEQIVASALGKRPQEIWPSRYERSRDRGARMTRIDGGRTALSQGTSKRRQRAGRAQS